MRRKILSISVAAYNVSSFLKRTLDSLLVEEPYRSKLDVFGLLISRMEGMALR